MPADLPTKDRRKARSGLKVIHRHRVGSVVVRRVSELMFVKGRAIALLEWINLGGIRTPLYICELELTKLRPDADGGGIYHYDDVTIDPRFRDVSAAKRPND